MDKEISPERISFLGRVGMAFRLIFNSAFAAEIASSLKALEQSKAKAAPPPERLHASGLLLLSALQREGRLIDFLQQDIAQFSDEEVGTAARVVHSGCKKILNQYLELAPAVPQEEGSPMTVPKGFDVQRTRLTGNVAGQPPYQGTLKHHGWVTKQIKLPAPSEALDPRVLAPAEVELT